MDDSFTISVRSVDDPPFVNTFLDDIVLKEDFSPISIQLENIFSDVDNDDSAILIRSEVHKTSDFFNYSILNNTVLNISSKQNKTGAATITLIGYSNGKEAEDTFILQVEPQNDPPVFQTSPVEMAIEGQTYQYEFSATDEENDPIEFSASVLPSWLTLVTGNVNRIEGSPTNAALSENNNVVIDAFDGTNHEFQSYTIMIISANYGPTISDIPEQITDEGMFFFPLFLDMYVSDPDNARDEILWTTSTESKVLEIMLLGNVVEVLPIDPYWNGTEDITFIATDPTGLKDSTVVRYTITPYNDPPQILSTPILTANAGEQYIYELIMEDMDQDVLTVNMIALPSWLTYEVENIYRLIGSPTKNDINSDNTVIIEVSDGMASITQTFEIVIPPNTPPTISNIDDQAIEQGAVLQGISFTINDIDTSIDQLTVSALSDNLTLVKNTKITIQGNEANRTIDIQPEDNAFGTVNILLSVSDGENTSSESFMLTVHAQPFADIDVVETTMTTGTTPLSVKFTPINVMHEVTSWLWDFGDGITSTEMKPEHTYFLNSLSVHTTYTVCLTVSGPGGQSTKVLSDYITVKDVEKIDFTTSQRKGVIPHTVQFYDQSININGSILWDFGDGEQSTTANASHTYTEPYRAWHVYSDINHWES